MDFGGVVLSLLHQNRCRSVVLKSEIFYKSVGVLETWRIVKDIMYISHSTVLVSAA